METIKRGRPRLVERNKNMRKFIMDNPGRFTTKEVSEFFNIRHSRASEFVKKEGLSSLIKGYNQRGRPLGISNEITRKRIAEIEEMLKEKPYISFKEVGERLGITRQSAHSLYKKYIMGKDAGMYEN